MELGLHLPLIDLGLATHTLGSLRDLVGGARRLGLRAIAANDHLVFRTPWLDGPTALASVLADAGDLDVMTTVALPIVRGSVALAKQLTALQVLAEGRVIAGVGPGSSAADHVAARTSFEDRWQDFESSLVALRHLLDGERVPVDGDHPLRDVVLEPIARHRIPLWIGSWGSAAGLRRIARAADGWLASTYNTTPRDFAAARRRLDAELESRGRDPATFPAALSTGFLHLADSRRAADRFLRDHLAPALGRSVDELRSRVFVGTTDDVAELTDAYRSVGLQRLLLWPLVDEVAQLEATVDLLAARSSGG